MDHGSSNKSQAEVQSGVYRMKDSRMDFYF